MATLSIHISTDNSAFEDNPDEIAGILNRLANIIDSECAGSGDSYGNLYDSNGARVGSWSHQ